MVRKIAEVGINIIPTISEERIKNIFSKIDKVAQNTNAALKRIINLRGSMIEDMPYVIMNDADEANQVMNSVLSSQDVEQHDKTELITNLANTAFNTETKYLMENSLLKLQPITNHNTKVNNWYDNVVNIVRNAKHRDIHNTTVINKYLDEFNNIITPNKEQNIVANTNTENINQIFTYEVLEKLNIFLDSFNVVENYTTEVLTQESNTADNNKGQ
ncbi:MAG: hypothetical protein LBQ34_07555 [Alphaproteobacteria bacterium]|nr:hypothetical protein [Alphaproteobacteria bacterium]